MKNQKKKKKKEELSKEQWRRKKERKKKKKGQKLRLTLTSGSLCVFNYQNAIGKKVMELENT